MNPVRRHDSYNSNCFLIHKEVDSGLVRLRNVFKVTQLVRSWAGI